jgi:hypothetical protein
MKRISILLAVLLSLAASSRADSINLTSGSGTMYPFQVAPGFNFELHGGGYDISIPGALDDPGGSLWNCVGCDPTSLVASPPLFVASGNLTVGDQFFSGVISFDAVSFVSSLAPNGILTVKYTATAFIQLFLEDSTTGLPIAGPFVWGNPDQPWYITAQFRPDLPSPLYTQMGATFSSSTTPVSEPATLMLISTGMLPVMLAGRRRLSRTSFLFRTSEAPGR